MRRAPAKPPTSISTSSGLRRRSARAVVIFAALLIGGLLAWALPALAGPGARGRASAPARRASAVVPRTSTPTGPSLTIATTATGGAASATVTTSSLSTTDTADTAIAAAAPSLTSAPPLSSVGTWSRPFAVLAPAASDLIAPLLAVSGSDSLAVGSGRTDEDAPAVAQAEVLSAGASDRFSAPLAPAATQETLAAGYLGARLVLVTGTSPDTESCCSSAATQVLQAGQLGVAQPLASSLEGVSTGALVPVRGGLLAAVDNQAGITVARSDASGSFSGAEQLVGSDPTPPLMAAGSLSDGGALIAWTAPASAAQTVTGTTTAPGSSSTASGYDQPRNQLIEYATAGAQGVPGAAKRAVTVPAGRQIDALQAVPHGAGLTLGWTESWYVANTYESRVFWSDVSAAGAGRVHTLSAASTSAVGLSGAGSSDGAEVLTWQACDIAAGTCDTQAALRPTGAAWGPVQSLGAVDPTSFPVATQSSRGQSLVGWISNGRVQAAAAAPGASDFSLPVQLSSAANASDLALSFGAGTKAAAVWVQGTYDQKLVGARFTP